MTRKHKHIISTLFLFVSYAILSIPGWKFLFSGSLVSSIDLSRILHPTLAYQIGFFLLFHILVFILTTIICLSIAHSASKVRPQLYTPTILLSFILLFYSLLGYAINHYPWLELSIISGSFSSYSQYHTIGIISALLLSFILTLSLLYNFKHSIKIAGLQFLAIAAFATPLIHFENTSDADLQAYSSIREKPDVILVGLDSVSLHQAKENPDLMPFVSHLLKQGKTYQQAFTPIGRTYGAWNSILSGRYPKNNDARFNLTEFKPNQIEQMLPRDLKKLGYFNIFSQDERRFNNINRDYGFDITVGPTVGAIDFIIPLFSDHLFTAYFTNSTIGKWLLPSLYNNRVSSITYNPQNFVKSIISSVNNAPAEKPLFIASHFCLAHFPYRWRTYDREINSHGHNEVLLYKNALGELDNQIESLFSGLKNQGRLNNAIIVLLSDHGEGIGDQPAMWVDYPQDFNKSQLKKFSQILRGHGNSILSRDQNSVILSINDKRKNTEHEEIDTPVSLVDIRPTILTMLEQKIPNGTVDGIPIPPATEYAKPARYLFMETGIMISLPKPNVTTTGLADSVKDKSDGYKINDDGLLVVTDEFIESSLNKKQYGVIYNDLLLISNIENDDQFLLINRKERSWETVNQNNWGGSNLLLEKLLEYKSLK